MTKDEALLAVKEMEDFLERVPGPGKNHEADQFFRERCHDLKVAVPFNADCANVVNWAGIYFSTGKWERYGDSKVRAFLTQSLAKVRSRTETHFGYCKD